MYQQSFEGFEVVHAPWRRAQTPLADRAPGDPWDSAEAVDAPEDACDRTWDKGDLFAETLSTHSAHEPEDEWECHPPLIRVFDKKQMPEEIKDREQPLLQRTIERMRDEALEFKPLARYPVDWVDQLQALDAKFPNFEAVTAYLREAYALSKLGDGRIALQPILLGGPPGVGKSEYARTLARMLGLSIEMIDMASAQTNAALSGLDSIYSTAQPGQLFKALVFGSHANPLIFLDELDKAHNNERCSPAAALYSLLEKGSARAFKDLSLPDVGLDASHVLWVAACNDSARIDGALRSRFRKFDIAAPTMAQGMHIARHVFQHLRDDEPWGSYITAELSDAVVQLLAQRPPRAMRQLLTTACAHAVMRGRRHVLPEDVPSASVEKNKYPFWICARLMVFELSKITYHNK